MLKNTSIVVHFTLIDEGTGDPLTAGTPTIHHAANGTVAAATNAAAYDSNNVWELTLTAAETNYDGFMLGIAMSGAVYKEIHYTPEESTATVVDAIWDESLSGEHTTTNTTGAKISAILTDTQTTLDNVVDTIAVDTGTTIPGLIAALNDIGTADVAAELATYDGPTNTEMLAATAVTDALIVALNDIAVSDITGDFGWQTGIGSQVTTVIGTNGAALTDLGGMSTAMKAEVNAEVDTALTDYDPPTQTELLAAHTTTDGLITTVDTVVDNILTDTAQIGTAGAGLTDLGGASTALKAEILVEVNAALDTAIAELGVAQPTATPTVRTGLMLLYMALRNKLDVATSGTDALEIHNDAGTQICSKVLTDDGSDYSEAKLS